MQINLHIHGHYGRFGNHIIILLKLMACFLKQYPDGGHWAMITFDPRAFPSFNHPIRFDPFHKRISDHDVVVNKKDYSAEKLFFVDDDITEPFLLETVRSMSESIFHFPATNPHPLPSDDILCVHSRSGDIATSHPHSHYVVYPSSLLTFLVKKFMFKEVWIIAEDPHFHFVRHCEKELRHIGCDVRIIHHNEWWKDWLVLSHARNLVLNYSTFTMTSIFFNPCLKNLYTVPYYMPYPRNNNLIFDKINIRIDNYIPYRNWKYNNEQKLMITNHDESFIHVINENIDFRKNPWA